MFRLGLLAISPFAQRGCVLPSTSAFLARSLIAMLSKACQEQTKHPSKTLSLDARSHEFSASFSLSSLSFTDNPQSGKT